MALGFSGFLFFIFHMRFSILGGKYSKHLFKAFGKVACGAESNTVCYFDHRQLTSLKKLRRTFQTNTLDKVGRSISGDGLQFPVQVHAGHSQITAQFFHCIFRVIHILFNIFQCTLNEFFVNGSDSD